MSTANKHQTVRLLTKAISPTDNVPMNALRTIRQRLDVSQAEMADALGVSQGNVSFYEKGQTLPPHVAQRLIDFSAGRGLAIGFDHVYGAAELPELAPKRKKPTQEA